MYQLAARMKILKDLFYETLFDLIINTATDHP